MISKVLEQDGIIVSSEGRLKHKFTRASLGIGQVRGMKSIEYITIGVDSISKNKEEAWKFSEACLTVSSQITPKAK